MLRRGRNLFSSMTSTAARSTASSANAGSSEASEVRSTAAASAEDASPAVSAVARATLHGLYRRLLACGEESLMMQRTLSTHTTEEAIRYGTRLLRYHRGLTQVDAQARQLSALRHPLKRTRLAMQRRNFAWHIFFLRLTLRSKNAISDALVYTLLIITCVLLYEIYRACRVGVDRAEERYRTMAVPILQTFDALEAMEERKKLMKKEMEADIVRQRSLKERFAMTNLCIGWAHRC